MNQRKPTQPLTKEDALARAMKYCAYQERCHKEVRYKLVELGMRGEELEEILVQLIEENFLNEERFARAYARGKHGLKKWGRNKIRRELEVREVSPYCIRMAMEEIDEAQYKATLEALIADKMGKTTAANEYQKNDKVARHLISKGYEAELVWQLIKGL